MFEIWYAITCGDMPLRADVPGPDATRASRVWDALAAAGFHMMNQRPACLSRVPAARTARLWTFSRKERNAVHAFHNGTISYAFAMRYLTMRGATVQEVHDALDRSAYQPDWDYETEESL